MDWLTEPFRFAFMQRALLAGMLAVAMTSTVGTWVVIRGMSFVGDALAHGVLPGIAVAFLVGVDPTIGAFVAALVMVAVISLVGRRSGLSDDTGIGLLFVGMLALGVVIISRSDAFTGDLTSFLFGNPLGVTVADLRFQAVALAIVLLTVALLYRPLLVLSFNETKSALLGLRPGLTHVAMMTLVGLAVVASFRAVGTLMTFGLLVAPPATAALLVRRVWLVMLVAVLLGWAAVVAGLLVSYHHDTAAGATMSGLAVAFFFVVLAAREVTARLPRLARSGT
jgi:zinc/manganese transport system permease protein/manganese/iron transport system permease protein